MEEEWPQDLSDGAIIVSEKPPVDSTFQQPVQSTDADESHDSWEAGLGAPTHGSFSEIIQLDNDKQSEETFLWSNTSRDDQEHISTSQGERVPGIESDEFIKTPEDTKIEESTRAMQIDQTQELPESSIGVLPGSPKAITDYQISPLGEDLPQLHDSQLSSDFTTVSRANIGTIEESADLTDQATDGTSVDDGRRAQIGDIGGEQGESMPWESITSERNQLQAQGVSEPTDSNRTFGTDEEARALGTSPFPSEERIQEPISHPTETPAGKIAEIDLIREDFSIREENSSESQQDRGFALGNQETANRAIDGKITTHSIRPAMDWPHEDDKNLDASQQSLDWGAAPSEFPSLADTSDGFDPSSKLTDDWLKSPEPIEDLEDSWAKALGSPTENLDDSWGAALGEDFGDEGFLEDFSQPESSNAAESSTLPPNNYQPSMESFASNQQNHSGSYAPPPAPLSVQSKSVAPPTDFFAELPITQTLRPRRPRMQVIPQPHSPPPSSLPPGPRSSIPPPSRNPSTAQFRGPERLDLFPPQPSVPPRSTSQNFGLSQFSSQPQPSNATNTRYSPTASQIPGHASPGSRSFSYNSRYATNPAQPVTAHQDPPSNGASIIGALPHFSSSNEETNPSYRDSQPLNTNSNTTGPPGRTSVSRYPPISGTYQSPQQNPEASGQYGGPGSKHMPSQAYSATPPTRPYAPRTSSPLAQSQQLSEQSPKSSPRRRQSATQEIERSIAQISPYDGLALLQSIPKRGSVTSTLHNIPESPVIQSTGSAVNAASYQAQSMAEEVEWPRRPRTQSPSATRENSITSMVPVERPMSVQSPTKPQQKARSQNLNFIIPEDERAADPLQRWKGSPVFRWGPGGHVLSTFPKHIPRYGGNQAQPMIKCVPGEVNLRKLREVLPIEETLISFPGPLKSKGKKKEVLSWLSSHIDVLEKQIEIEPRGMPFDQIEKVAVTERGILWKLMRLLVEYDGSLGGNPSVDQAVRQIISPYTPLDPGGQHPSLISDTARSASPMSAGQADAVNPQALEEMRNSLLLGNREKAVWHAVDHRLWGHAMLISSTVSTDLWKQVSQEFVRKEVQSAQAGNKSLATLYEIFAGNREESIDELVPPSARAGFKMVSAGQGAGQNLDATSGLDQWRETLGLILSNRSVEDEKAISSLGKLLAVYGRTEAAHICFLFSRSASPFGGADDPQANFTLIGADHSKKSFEAIKDLDAILLSEVYEFALSLAPSGASPYVPHLQAYKLSHAFALVEYGHRNEALQYCEALSSVMRSTTKPSQYFHSALINQVDDLTKRLSQSPKDGQQSWMSKTFTEKARGSLLAKFNSFIDPRDAESSSGEVDTAGTGFGPFANINSGTPTISRSPSNTDFYNPQSGGQGLFNRPSMTGMNSRYAPSSYTPRSSHDDQQSLSAYGSYSPLSSYMPEAHNQPHARSPYEPHGGAQLNGAYSPATAQTLLEPVTSKIQSFSLSSVSGESPSTSYEPYVPTAPQEPADQPYAYAEQPLPHQNSDDTHSDSIEIKSYNPTANGYTPASQSYEISGNDFESPNNSYTPMTSGYEPPSYQPYQIDATADEMESPTEARKKSSIMDDQDDDDLGTKAAELKKAEKARKDEEADDAVRRAAEADAQRDLNKKPSGWLGGWFGKKDGSTPVHKVKLGEESSFYYDPETKRWVNKKADLSGAAPTAPTPPPPKSRVTSASGPPSAPPSSGTPSRPPTSSGLPQPSMSNAVITTGSTIGPGDTPSSGPASRAGTPLSQSSMGAADTSVSLVGPQISDNSPPSFPPSRPSTGMSNASSIDDLLGAAAPRKGGTIKSKKRGGRYVDVMAK